MFLKSVEIFGFKSFADRSHIDFSDGICALLGPNGCGKSNVVDSIKWVLGEQSTRALRAERMEDVIFNGTENRKPQSLAEVTLTLTNDTDILPIDLPEIAIKRRLHRSGESEYFINDAPVKLKEVRELFFDTGIGKSAYSIMEQGKIDQILSNKPEERRYLFEEAAGITRYKVKSQEAERKLEKTDENMRQVESVLTEVRRSYTTLKNQSEKTEQYRKLRDTAFQLDVDIQLLRLKDFMERKHLRDQKIVEEQEKRDALKQAIDELNDQMEENLDLVNTMEKRNLEHQKQTYALALELNSRESQLRIFAERRGELGKQIESENRRIQSVNEKILRLSEERDSKKAIVDEFARRLSELENNIVQFETDIRAAGERIRSNEEAIRTTETHNHELTEQEEALQKEYRKITDVIVSELDKRLKDSGYSNQKRGELEEGFQNALESLRISVDGKASLLRDAALSPSDGASGREILDRAIAVLEDAVRKAEDLRRIFEEYRSQIPVFLDEFLAPEGIITQKRELDAKMERLREDRKNNQTRIEELRTENRHLVQKIDEYRKTLEELRLNSMKMKTQRSAIEESVVGLNREIAEQQKSIEDVLRIIAGCQERCAHIDAQTEKIEEELEGLEKKKKTLEVEMKDLEKNILHKSAALRGFEQELKQKTEQLAKIQGSLERSQMEAAEINTEIKNIYANFKENHGRELEEFDGRMFEIKRQLKSLKDELAETRDKIKNLGSVNLMAVEEFSEVKERFQFLSTQLEDLRKAKEDLKKVTRELEEESIELFTATYEKIRKNFHIMFRRLFGGGRAEVTLVEPGKVLESGIEIYAQPPGKKLENIALLSGGERSLTAISLLFATYLVKPSPFCILDEIDAAMDETNVGRFVSMLGEFAKSSQFIIITHNKKTVAGCNTLLGVTMQESGVSKVVAIRIDNRSDRGVAAESPSVPLDEDVASTEVESAAPEADKGQ